MNSFAKPTTTHSHSSGDLQPGAYAVATPANPTTTTGSSQQSKEMTPRSSFTTEAKVVVSQPPVAVTDNINYNKYTEPPSVVSAYQYVFVDSREPVVLTYCPKCYQENVTTRTHTVANGITAVCVVAGAFIFFPLCWLPMCIKPMKQTNHYCTKCGHKVGRVKPFQ